MNKKYEMPEFLVQELDIENVIATSIEGGLGVEENFGDQDSGYGELH